MARAFLVGSGQASRLLAGEIFDGDYIRDLVGEAGIVSAEEAQRDTELREAIAA